MNALAGVPLAGLSAADWRTRIALLQENGAPLSDADVPPAACRDGAELNLPIRVRAAGVPGEFAALLRAVSAPKGAPDASIVVRLSRT
jgi:hypothetical protein